jgi:hypothetical protein
LPKNLVEFCSFGKEPSEEEEEEKQLEEEAEDYGS